MLTMESTTEEVQNSSDRPLLSLFENSNIRESDDYSTLRSIKGHQKSSTFLPDILESALQEIRIQIPDSKKLLSILRAGQSTLKLWTEAFHDLWGGKCF